MTEHESNLLDLYAGLAAVGLAMRGQLVDVGETAWWVADELMRVRKERADARQAKEGTVSDMAVSDMEGREDSDTQGIAALKKTKARSKSA